MLYQGAIFLIFKGFPIFHKIFINFDRFLQMSIDFVCFFNDFHIFLLISMYNIYRKIIGKPFENLSKTFQKSIQKLFKNHLKIYPKTSPKPLQKPTKNRSKNLSKTYPKTYPKPLIFETPKKLVFAIYIYIQHFGATWSDIGTGSAFNG